MTTIEIRRALISAGVRNLKEFGYPAVNQDNILTDFVYAKFFDGMLEEHEGPGSTEAKALREQIAPTIANGFKGLK